MKKLGKVLVLVGALMSTVAPLPAFATGGKGRSYSVHVFTSFGTNFSDCYTFAANGTLLVALFGPLTYRSDELNAAKGTWQATSKGDFVLSFHGTFGGVSAQTLDANGVSSEGDTYIVQGVAAAQCTTPKVAGSRYRR